MPKRVKYARIAITLPTDDLAAANRLAQQHDRPRSWIVAEAVRRYAAEPPAASAAATGLGESRRRQLALDLRLTPEERVRAAEETARIALRHATRVQRAIGFDRYEDYVAWKRFGDLRP